MHQPTDPTRSGSHPPSRPSRRVAQSQDFASSLERARRRRRAGKPHAVSGKTHPEGWARNWARVRRHREPMDMARSGEVGGSTEHPARVIPTDGSWCRVRAGATSPDDLCRRDLPALSTPSTKRPRTKGCDETDGPAISSEVVPSEASPRRPRRTHVRDFAVTSTPGTCPRTRGSTTMTSIRTEFAVRLCHFEREDQEAHR
jgi:hypothetical protein